MIQRQYIDALYLKFIGVTLMMTAACIPGYGQGFANDDDYDVREIILEHFHFLSPGSLYDFIEWENAITQVAEMPEEGKFFSKYIYYKLLVVNNTPDYSLLNYLIRVDSNCQLQVNCSELQILRGTANIGHTLTNFNKYSLVTRAGPLA